MGEMLDSSMYACIYMMAIIDNGKRCGIVIIIYTTFSKKSRALAQSL